MTNYQTAVNRIKRAKSEHDLDRLNNSFQNCHKYGLLTDAEYMRLDSKIVEKLITIEDK
jgi:hypothetical protein